MASGTSRETEIKLMNVARASLEELLEDHRDFLRTRGLIDTRPAEVVANIAIRLFHQTNYLLDWQIRSPERAFLDRETALIDALVAKVHEAIERLK